MATLPLTLIFIWRSVKALRSLNARNYLWCITAILMTSLACLQIQRWHSWNFFNILNSHHSKIKLKFNLKRDTVEFLDTRVSFTSLFDNSKLRLATKVFFKETYRRAFLFKSSYHPQHTFCGLIKSQLLTFRRICTYPDDIHEATEILFRALANRGYAKRFLRSIKQQVMHIFINSDQLWFGVNTAVDYT